MIAVIVLSAAATVANFGCTSTEIAAGLCSISPSTTDTAVVLDGTVGGPPSAAAPGDDWTNTHSDDAPVVETPCVSGPLQPDRCFGVAPARGEPTTAAPGVPAVTLADIATFTPVLAPAVSEPGGWAIAGLPVNLIGPQGGSIVDGTLLGSRAQVRFTPVRWRWDHGDGSVVAVPTGGASWAALGVAEFARTPTSHVYLAPGTYRVALDVVVIAEYRIGGGAWAPVPGALTVRASQFDLIVATADTVLVDRDCRTAPAGPGC